MAGSLPIQGEVYLETEAEQTTDRPTEEQTSGTFWLADSIDDGQVRMTMLNIDGERLDLSEQVELNVFPRRFLHQPDYSAELFSPRRRMIEAIVDLADEHRREEHYNSAEYEYRRALNLDEEHVRANFGLGETYLATGEAAKAREIFIRLTRLKAVYTARHKHLFNDLGIKLRKLGLYREALEHYHRALTVAQDDEHLWFNIARTLHEDGQPDLARKILEKALGLNPGFKLAQLVLDQGFPAADSGPDAAAPATEPNIRPPDRQPAELSPRLVFGQAAANLARAGRRISLDSSQPKREEKSRLSVVRLDD